MISKTFLFSHDQEKDTRQERVIPVSHHEHEPQQNHQQNQNPQRMGNQSLFDSTFNDPFFNRASTFAENRFGYKTANVNEKAVRIILVLFLQRKR